LKRGNVKRGIKMGMIACLQMVEEQRIKDLFEKDADELFDEVEEMQENTESILDIDKFWDGIHFLLTGVSACEPMEGNLLSEFIAGTSKFIDDDDTDYIAYVLPDNVKAITNEINCLDIDTIINDFQPKVFAQSGIYPNIWMRENKEDLQKEMKKCFIALKAFYEKASSLGKGIIISIY